MARFSTRDLALIAVLAALGIAVKPVVVPLAHLITSPLFIPGGALAGGLYMMWLVVGMGIVGKRGTATLIALTQALLVMFTGVVGSHGALSLLSYTAPGIVMDLGLLLVGHTACCLGCCVLAGFLANVTGTLMVSFIFFRLPPLPLALAVSTAALAGMIGGALAWEVVKLLRRYRIGVGPPRGAGREAGRGEGRGSAVTITVIALVATLALAVAGCAAGDGDRSGKAASDLQEDVTQIPYIYGTTQRNGTLRPRAVSSGASPVEPVPLNDTLRRCGERAARRVSVYCADGSIVDVAAKTCTLAPSGRLLVAGREQGPVAGIILDPPRASVRDVAALVRNDLAAGTKVLVVCLDGFGWDQYVARRRSGDTPHLAGLSVAKAATVFPTITPVTFAAMVSGEDPATTGVHDRSSHTLSCPTVFGWAEDHGKRTSLIEGDLGALDLTANTVLNTDADGDGFTDDEVFMAAKSRLVEGQPDLMLVHFHGIDDAAHADGPFSAATAGRVRSQDAMVGRLMKLWKGRVVVVADHGLHAVDDTSGDGSRGEHGAFRAEDLFVPLLIGTT